LTVNEDYTFGEFTPNGQYSIKIQNSPGIGDFQFNYYPSTVSGRSYIKYSINLSDPFLKIGNEYQDFYSLSYDNMIVDSKVDSLFQMALTILQKHTENQLYTDFEMRSIPSTVQLNYQNDSIESILLANCDWRELRAPVGFNFYWSIQLNPREVTKYYYSNKKVVKSETIDCFEKTYIRKENSWTKDSSILTIRMYNKSNSLVKKLIQKYKGKIFLAAFSIDSQNGDTIKETEITNPKPKEKVIIEYSRNKPNRKTYIKTNDFDDIIDLSMYELDTALNKFVLSDKRTSKYEYYPDKKPQKLTFYNQSNAPISSSKYYYGPIK
jgi:hypothetical protein